MAGGLGDICVVLLASVFYSELEEAKGTYRGVRTIFVWDPEAVMENEV